MEEVNYAAQKHEDLRPAGTTRVMLLLPETSSQTQQKSELALIRLCSLNTIRLLRTLQDQTHSLLFMLILYLSIHLAALVLICRCGIVPTSGGILLVAHRLTSCGARAQLLLGCEILESPPGIEPRSTAFQGGL